MAKPTRLLLFEADKDAAAEAVHVLAAAARDFDVLTVTAEADLPRAVVEFAPEIIVANPAHTRVGWRSVMDCVAQICPETPVILVAQHVTAKAAVEALRGGACDYRDSARTRGLPKSVERALADAAARVQKTKEQRETRTNEERHRYFLEQTTEGFYRLDFDPPIPVDLEEDEIIARMYESGRIAECNRIYAQTYGFATPEAMVGTRLLDLHGGAEPPANIGALRRFIRAGFRHLGVETVEANSAGAKVYLSNSSVGIIEAGHYVSCWGTQRDISEQRRAEELVNESREQLRALLARLWRAQEDERKQVARDIHDELGQLLTGLKMDVRWLEGKLSRPEIPPQLNALLDRAVAASELVDRTISTVQEIAAKIRPGELDHLGLAAALAGRGRRFEERSEIRCHLSIAEPQPDIPAETANELFYICQEALTNVARHSGASEVEISLREEGGELVLEIGDDGAGIDLSKCRSPSSLGLLGMEERALQCGGMMEVARRQPRGTRVIARVPRDGGVERQGGAS